MKRKLSAWEILHEAAGIVGEHSDCNLDDHTVDECVERILDRFDALGDMARKPRILPAPPTASHSAEARGEEK